MNPETIRKIDIGLGKIACFKLTCLRRIVELFPVSKPPLPPIGKILFIKLIEQGATVLACGAIRRAVQMAGRGNVFFLVFEENREILDIMDLIPKENILEIRNKGFIVFLFDLLRNLFVIRRLSIDTAIDMEFFARASAVISFLTGAKRRVGFHRFTSELPYRGDLMTHRIHYNPYLHTAQTYLLLVEALEMPPGDIPLPKKAVKSIPEEPPKFNPSPEETAHLKGLLSREGVDWKASGPVILLNPNASDMLPLRKWPLENFISLASSVLKYYPEARLVITGAPAEKEAADQFCLKFASSRVVSLAGKTTLRELLVLYVLADVLVTNDSGPAHFASLTNINSVVLYGPETPKLFGAIGKNSHAIYAKLACSPCVNAFNHRFSPCTNNLCMKSISPEEVYGKVRECLEAGKSG